MRTSIVCSKQVELELILNLASGIKVGLKPNNLEGEELVFLGIEEIRNKLIGDVVMYLKKKKIFILTLLILVLFLNLLYIKILNETILFHLFS